MYYYFFIFKTNIYIITSTISNNSRFHTTVHHSGFTKTVFSRSFHVWIGYFAFFKLIILFMYYYFSIFKTDINIFSTSVSNNSSLHFALHLPCFTKAVFSIWMGYITFFKRSIRFMFHHSPILEMHINICSTSISNDCSFHTTVHHACFANSIYFCYHKLSLAFCICSYPIYVRISQILISSIQQKRTSF